MLKKILLPGFLCGLAFPFVVHAQEQRIDEMLTSYTVWAIIATSVLVGILTLIGLTNKEPSETLKKFLFWGMAIPVSLVTIFVAGSTVYLNIISDTKGPVHWHADFKILYCGQEINLVDPTGLSNKIGTPLFHEHDDLRIHVEGTVHQLEHVSLGSFFEVIGGSADHGVLTLPAEGRNITMTNGDFCRRVPEWENKPAEINVFVYQTEGNEVYQKRLVDWPSYVIRPETVVPPGDCIIVEFSPEVKGQTNQICDFYAIELNKGSLKAANFDYGN